MGSSGVARVSKYISTSSVSLIKYDKYILEINSSVLSKYFKPIYISKILICRDPTTSSGIDQTTAFHRAVTNRILTANCRRNVISPKVEIVDLHSAEFAAIKFPAEIGKARSNYLRNLANHTKRSVDNDIKSSLASTECLDADRATDKRLKRQKTVGETLVSLSSEANKLRPCAISFNWIRDVSHDTNINAVSNQKQCEGVMVSGGSLEMTQAHNGILQGATKKNIHRGICSSRLSRRNMALLFDQILPPSPSSSASHADSSSAAFDHSTDPLTCPICPTDHPTSIKASSLQLTTTEFVYADWKNSHRSDIYTANLRTFKQTPTFESWDIGATNTNNVNIHRTEQ